MNLLASAFSAPSQTFVPLSWLLWIGIPVLVLFAVLYLLKFGDAKWWRTEAEILKDALGNASGELAITKRQRDHSREEFAKLSRKYALCLKAVLTCRPAKPVMVNDLQVNIGELIYDINAVEAAKSSVSPSLCGKSSPELIAAIASGV